ncbi:TPA: hypothetical protein U2I61_000357 [Providencia rettgeri]|nr:hypothetical protein [Providencia rettgeri]
MHDPFCYIEMKPSEFLNEAIMSETTFIIVEGVDDVPVYERLVESIEKKIIIVDIKNITNSEGCSGVKDFILDVNTTPFHDSISKHILGVIDRDIKPYRNEVINNVNNIIMLNYYSMESHFLSLKSVDYMIKNITRAGNLLNEYTLNLIYEKAIDEVVDFIFYPSLEALKNGCVENYKSLVGYKMSIEQIINMDSTLLEHKKDELDLFSKEKGINKNFDSILLMSKGKWILKLFCMNVVNLTDELHRMCKDGEILKCQYCTNKHENDCQYKKIKIGTIDVIVNDVLRRSSLVNLEYVLDEIKALVVH